MRNLEVKVSARDRQSTVRLLEALGAKHVCTMKQDDYYFGVGTDKIKLRIIDDCEYQLITYRRIEEQGRKDSSYEISELDAKEKDFLLQNQQIVKSVEKARELWLCFLSTFSHAEGAAGSSPYRAF
jgi:adenylate cyclase class IV